LQLETTPSVRESNFAELSRRALLRSYAPASVLTDAGGNILFVHGETGKYLRPAPGHASFNVIDMARGALQQELRLALHLAASKGTPTAWRAVQLGTNGTVETISFSVHTLPESGVTRPRRGGGGGPPPPRGRGVSRNWNATSSTRAKACRAPSSSSRLTTRSSVRPMRNCNPPTRNCNRPTRSWRPRRRNCNRSTRNW
jgi:hypothetical protein